MCDGAEEAKGDLGGGAEREENPRQEAGHEDKEEDPPRLDDKPIPDDEMPRRGRHGRSAGETDRRRWDGDAATREQNDADGDRGKNDEGDPAEFAGVEPSPEAHDAGAEALRGGEGEHAGPDAEAEPIRGEPPREGVAVPALTSRATEGEMRNEGDKG